MNFENVLTTLKSLKENKSTGLDKIPAGIFYSGADMSCKIL